MNKDFIKELKVLAKKYNSDIIFKCCYCETLRSGGHTEETHDYITIVEKEKPRTKIVSEMQEWLELHKEDKKRKKKK